MAIQQELVTGIARTSLSPCHVIRDSAAMSEAHTLLLVDDDARLRVLIERYLSEQGFQVRAVANLAGMRKVLSERHVDLIVLDLMLPDGDGLDACRRLRAEGVETPVIMLTAKGDEIDRVVGLEIGADDYVPKPAAPRELLARIRARLRRAGAHPGAAPRTGVPAMVFGAFTLQLDTRQLSRDGVAVRLTSGEFAVLAALAQHARRPLSRDHLMNLARGEDHGAFDRSIDVMVSRLRKLIETDPRQPRYLQTVWGVGYVFVPEGERA
jgi:two-component system phosphate regulon response regulator OmpR